MSKIYIQRRGQGYTETVSEYQSGKEARSDLKEYQLSDPSATYYLSQRPCANWGGS